MREARHRIAQTVEESLVRLEEWVERCGWEGWDPYDIRGEVLFRKLQSVPLVSPKLRLFTFAFPYRARKAFRIHKRAYSEAMAAFSRAYLNLWRSRDKEEYGEKAVSCLEWLKENRCEGVSEFCWGAAFDWKYGNLLIPKGTPDSTATSMAARAFFDAFKETEQRKDLEIAESACRFLLKGLNVDHLDEERLCFSYTPLDSTHVHNANLFNAGILAVVGKELANEEFLSLATKALTYTLSCQNSDGSWYYRGPPDRGGRFIDNYHTGFVLRNLCYLYSVLGEERIREAMLRGYEYYQKSLFSDSIPKLTPGKLYPVDIYSCAEAILCLATLSRVFPGALDGAIRVAEWTIENMQDRSGYFYNRKYRLFPHRFPYIRWGQAIMLEALSYLLRVLESGRSE